MINLPTHNTGLINAADELAKPMPIINHLTELRRRFIWCAAVFVLSFGAAFAFAKPIYAFLNDPLVIALHGTEGRRMIYTGLAEAFVTYLKVAMFTAMMVTLPFFINQLWRFIAPGLYARERAIFTPFLIASPILFLAGTALAYFFVLPMAWHFFLSFESAAMPGNLPIQLEARVSEYLSLTMQILFAFGISFQLPIFLGILLRTGIATKAGLRRYRRHAIVAVLVLAAVLTPPDIFSQIALALPLWILYEGSILFFGKKEEKAAATE
jgi:sec-independent protein translocase protein TatC